MSNVATIERAPNYAVGNEAIELRSFWLGHEAQIGFRSSWEAAVAAANGVAVRAGDPDRQAEVLDWSGVGKGHATWRALQVMDLRRQAEALVVLHRLYGGVRVPGEYVAAFGPDAGALVTLTEAAEQAREQLALRRGTERETVVRMHGDAATESSRAELAETFWRAVRSEERACYAGNIERADAWRTVQRNALHAYRADGRLAARLSTLAGADRETTVADAIAVRLEDKDPARKSEFITAVRKNGMRLKEMAHSAYRTAKVSLR